MLKENDEHCTCVKRLKKYICKQKNHEILSVKALSNYFS